MRAILFSAFALALAAPALAQPKDEDPSDSGEVDSVADQDDQPAAKGAKKGKPKEKLFDFTALKLDGSTRMPQLLYFLERASEELSRASLKRRSFVPEMVRSMDEDAL